jgi:2-hydroxycyclohexanecarboxyl-CoA dehydrogenase
MEASPPRVIITGAGRGIGFATARLFIAQGAAVAVLALHRESAEAAAAALGPGAWPFWGDLADRAVNERVMADAADALGGVDILVNNAGWTLTQNFLDEDPEYWDRVIRLNLSAVVWSSRTVLRRMVEQGAGGSIVNVVSDAGRVGMQGEAVYAAAKGGVIALTKSLAQEMARHRIRVNAVAPGPTNTRVLEENLGVGPDAERKIQSMIRRIPLREVAEPEDVAEAILFLAGPGARLITGQVLSVSGGLTMV